jgi:hypothetical protein
MVHMMSETHTCPICHINGPNPHRRTDNPSGWTIVECSRCDTFIIRDDELRQRLRIGGSPDPNFSRDLFEENNTRARSQPVRRRPVVSGGSILSDKDADKIGFTDAVRRA